MSNVKAGDLAVIVRATNAPANLGRFVHVARVAVPNERFQTSRGAVRFESSGELAWVIEADSPLMWTLCDGLPAECRARPIDDALLRPLRDSDGEDEMTRIAGKPTEEQDRLWAEFDTAMSELEKRLAERTA